MIANINESPLKTYSKLPKYWDPRFGTMNYDKLPESELFADGWRDVVVPPYDASIMRLGGLIFNEESDKVTYEVIVLSPEELEAERKSLVPLSISKLQAMIMLGRLGIKDGVLNLVSTSDNLEVQSYFEYAATWERASPIINSLAPALGMSQLDLDNFFSEAEKIN
jgi:hypothetical protein